MTIIVLTVLIVVLQTLVFGGEMIVPWLLALVWLNEDKDYGWGFWVGLGVDLLSGDWLGFSSLVYVVIIGVALALRKKAQEKSVLVSLLVFGLVVLGQIAMGDGFDGWRGLGGVIWFWVMAGILGRVGKGELRI